MTSSVAFDRIRHLVRVPVTVGGAHFRFLVDTGIGLTIVSSALARRDDVVGLNDTARGRRMSGQALELPLVRMPELRVGEHVVVGHLAAVADLGGEGPSGFDGILGPGFFEGCAVTTDPEQMTVTVAPSDSVHAPGPSVPVIVYRDGLSWVPFVRLALPSGRIISVELDTGSGNLILDTRFMEDCGLEPDQAAMSTTTGVDETGHPWTRHHTTIPGTVFLADAPETAQAQPRVQFQDIVHDGLLGTDYLERFRYTFDVTGRSLTLGPIAVRGE